MAASDRDRTPDDPSAAPDADPALVATVPADAERPAARRSPPISLLARYEDLELLGEGGMGIVYRGHDARLGRAVALKLIKGDDPEMWRRFIQEARAQARVQHENVCRVYEAGQADGEPYIVMQLIDGEPLSHMRDALSLEQRVKLVREVASAVHEAHRLGLIHRDIKPQNVLVEKQDDGALKPYVMDFGLAREVAERGATMTGAVVGTPAYMPPEQALGDVRAMDRRSDVYALGATLYDLIAGRPPFVAEHPLKVLMAAAHAEPPPLGRVKKGVPGDLEVIVMKCLERDPGRRYDSARALAEDLQRFLDGEPVHAKRASVAYVVWKKARKHKLATALAATVLGGSLALFGVWAKGRRDAAREARIAQALGEDVKGMELFLRNAYGMPLHDVERERDLVRQRLARIEANMAAAGRVGQGPGHYAMGRGHLALGDPVAARAHLEKARAAGYTSAALDNALGQALGELYRRALEETKRITNEAERNRRVAALAKELRDPALALLRAAVGAEIEAPAYAEGLIALYEGKHEGALAKAREAFAKTPWLYEAKKLEGDALYAMGSPFRHDAAFDWDKMMACFGPAAAAYREASELARSDPEVHRAECELWEKIGWAESSRDTPRRESFDAAVAACERAVSASHADGRARVQRALVLSSRANLIVRLAPDEALPLVDLAVRAAEEAVRASPSDAMAHYAAARARFERLELVIERDQQISAEPIVAAYRRAVELDPNFTWAITELGDAYIVAAEIDRRRGRDTRAALANAARQFDEAARIDPSYSMPAQSQVKVAGYLLQDELARGASTDASASALFDAVKQLEKHMGSNPWLVVYWRARANRLKGLHELAQDRDPRASIEAAMTSLKGFMGASRTDPWLLLELGECLVVMAAHALLAGNEALPHLEGARAALRDAAAAMTTVSDVWRLLAARTELLAIRDAGKRGALRAESFEPAFAPLRPMLSKATTDPRPYQLMAEIHARRAAWLAESSHDPREDLAAGRALVEDALSRNPRLAAAFATRGLLDLAEAIAARPGGAREAAAKRAKEAFDAAVRESPAIARDYGDDRKRLAALAP